ncbi:Plasmodium variant antigen protein Cir/Yir/Bir, putative [Plasmodium chabaudi chabaudi]|uniref:Plasmodium variant antigen protein Cir/Yir/Bir, putative n=1 Tax=Plasmodium chabaudi chabaudi TaxID=31271 RepID=A0A1D3L7Y6_PLACU|nr:Plasmodium variant antigen protein Cir/Yir/Bir, putative [Plasmodium chabaudi chabaudi]
MSEELCKVIDDIENFAVYDSEYKGYKFDDILKTYCPNNKCDTDVKNLGSAFMTLLEVFKKVDDYDDNLKNDILSQYAILWFNSKVKINENFEAETNNIYNILKENGWIDEYHQYTDRNENIMKFHYIFLKNLYELLKGICDTINKCKSSSNPTECQESAEKCGELYRTCLITFPWKEICNPYCRVLSNLKKDYEKIKEKYSDKNLPELKPPPGIESCEISCAKKNQELKVKELKTNTVTEVSLPVPSVTHTSINNGNKLPYIAVPLILIPIILGISYKFLAPAWRKREKKKTMKKIINLSDQKKA